MLNLQIEQAALKYVERNWKKSTLNATIQLLINGKGVPSPESIVLDMEQLYKICALLRHFHKDKSTPAATQKQRPPWAPPNSPISTKRSAASATRPNPPLLSPAA
jgi:hypothetical protein